MKTIHPQFGRRATVITALAVAGIAVALAGCLESIPGRTDGPIKGFQGSRWIKTDSLMALTFSRAEYKSGKYVSSRIELYTLELDADGFTNSQLLFAGDSMVPCGRLIYRASDSLLAFSYLPFTSGNGGDVNCDIHQRPGRRIFAGTWGRSPFTPAWAPVDTAALLTELSQSGSHDGRVSPYGSSLCVGDVPDSPCIFEDDL